jgi:CBS domain-containing protein
MKRQENVKTGRSAARSVGSRRRPARPVKAAAKRLRAKDLMTRDPITVPAEMTIGDLCDLLQENSINGAPVVDARGQLVGVVTQEDIVYGAMGHPENEPASGTAAPPSKRAGRREKPLITLLRQRRLAAVPPSGPAPGERPFWADLAKPRGPLESPVRAIMTSPAISAEEDTPLTDLCRIMWNLRIHRVPIVKKGKVTGLVSSMDLCRAILAGKIKV